MHYHMPYYPRGRKKKSFALESSSSGDTKEALEEVVLLTRKVFHSGKKSEMMIAPHL